MSEIFTPVCLPLIILHLRLSSSSSSVPSALGAAALLAAAALGLRPLLGAW